MAKHEITIKIISFPENNILRPQSYTLQKITADIRIFYTR